MTAHQPTVRAPWATQANYPHDASPEQDTPTKITYSSGKSDYGFRPGEEPTGMELNDWLNRIGLWVDYLANGNLDGPIAIDTTTGDFSIIGTGAVQIAAASIELDGPIEINGDVTLDLNKTITAIGRNSRGLLTDEGTTTLLSRNVSLDDRSWDNSFGGGGTLSRTELTFSGLSGTTSFETKLTISTATAHTRGMVDLEPGDEIAFVTLAYDGPVPTGTWPDVHLIQSVGGRAPYSEVILNTDGTAANHYREGGASIGAGRTWQRYTVPPTAVFAIPTSLINSTTDWQVGGSAGIYIVANQNNTDIFRVSVEYRRRPVPTSPL